MSIEFEDKDTLLEWKDEFDMEPFTITMPEIPYSLPEIERELIRRDNIEEEVRSIKIDKWLNAHKIQPCPLCGKTFSKRGRGMAYHSARRHVLACKGE